MRTTALLLGLLTTAGCVCTEVGCFNSINLTLERDAWPQATYTIEVTIAGDRRRLEVALPEGACTGAGTDLQGGSVRAIGLRTQPGSCDVPLRQVRLEVYQAGPADEVTVRISQGGALILDRALTPAYTTVEPNGPHCGPTCYVSSETLRL